MEKRADEVDIRPHLLAIHHFAPRVYAPGHSAAHPQADHASCPRSLPGPPMGDQVASDDARVQDGRLTSSEDDWYPRLSSRNSAVTDQSPLVMLDGGFVRVRCADGARSPRRRTATGHDKLNAIFPRVTEHAFAEHDPLPRRNRSLHAPRLESTLTNAFSDTTVRAAAFQFQR